ncbi:hypothetical protein GGR53DRAFT_497829 [Hypoxylon sp. FL1150]|nr:hypothetical protein GGR53DRAFT_497829 [Hypoxylon sp. FL1150]
MGEPPDDDEHEISPILKLIDFGGTEKAPPIEAADHQNIFDIGKIMLDIINLGRGRVAPAGTGSPAFSWNKREIKTEAAALVPCPSNLDEVLCNLVCLCMATNANSRPTLKFLLNLALRGFREATVEYYDNDPDELDGSINNLWRRILTEASVDDDDDDDDDGGTEDWSTTVASSATSRPSTRPSTQASTRASLKAAAARAPSTGTGSSRAPSEISIRTAPARIAPSVQDLTSRRPSRIPSPSPSVPNRPATRESPRRRTGPLGVRGGGVGGTRGVGSPTRRRGRGRG